MDPVYVFGWAVGLLGAVLALYLLISFLYAATNGFSWFRTKPEVTKEMREEWVSRISVKYQGKNVDPGKTWKAAAMMWSKERGEDGREIVVEDATFYGRTRGGAERKARKFIDAARRERFSAWLVV